VQLGRVQLDDGGTLWWEETRPDEDGRTCIVRCVPGWEAEEIFTTEPGPSAAFSVLGGWLPAGGGDVVVTGDRGRRLYLLRPGKPPRPLTPERGGDHDCTYADLVRGPDAREVWCVRESWHGGEVDRQVVAVPLDGSRDIRVVLTTTRFISTPRPSPAGTHLAWITWDALQMPWDASELRVGPITPAGVADASTVLGGPTESVFQPEWAGSDSLYAVSDRSRWWNLYQVWLDGALRPLCPWSDEFGWPQSDRGLSTYGRLPDGRLAVLHGTGEWRLDLLDPDDGTVTPLDLPFTSWQPTVAVSGNAIAGVAGAPVRPAVVILVDAETRGHRVVRLSAPEFQAGYLPSAHPTTFTGRDGHEVHAVVHPPHNPTAHAGRADHVPYILFLSEGPGGQANGALDMATAFFTSRGLGVVDIHGRGSSGYGRAYREHLYGQWGIADVEDCAVVARGLVRRWNADPARLVIRAVGTAGSTALGVLASTDVCAAATVHGGISDLAALAAESTHPFVAYLHEIAADSLLLRRSAWLDRVRRPVLICHGRQDAVVPVSQAMLLRAALRRSGTPHACLIFPGEDHVFHRADTISRTLEAELSFYGQVLGFEPARTTRLTLECGSPTES
jgi:dipeptidyl aminopeptidase/acylaminoacyl peptidase